MTIQRCYSCRRLKQLWTVLFLTLIVVLAIIVSESTRTENMEDFGIKIWVTADYVLSRKYSSKLKNETVRMDEVVFQIGQCPVIPPHLDGTHKEEIDGIQFSGMDWNEIEEANSAVEFGGHHQPKNCIARHNLAIIIPYREREDNLKMFLTYINKYLQRQQLNYTIFVVEQLDNYPFNRGVLFNVGVVESRKVYNFSCYALHDVDLLPENDKNLYICDDAHPIHLAVYQSKHNYRFLYDSYFGGVCLLTADQLIKMNGFSNLFWGWGGEDDDFYNRLVKARFEMKRYPSDVARYTMLRHVPGKVNPERFKILRSAIRHYRRDGLNSVKYEFLKIHKRKLFTLIQVRLKSNNKTE